MQRFEFHADKHVSMKTKAAIDRKSCDYCFANRKTCSHAKRTTLWEDGGKCETCEKDGRPCTLTPRAHLYHIAECVGLQQCKAKILQSMGGQAKKTGRTKMVNITIAFDLDCPEERTLCDTLVSQNNLLMTSKRLKSWLADELSNFAVYQQQDQYLPEATPPSDTESEDTIVDDTDMVKKFELSPPQGQLPIKEDPSEEDSVPHFASLPPPQQSPPPPLQHPHLSPEQAQAIQQEHQQQQQQQQQQQRDLQQSPDADSVAVDTIDIKSIASSQCSPNCINPNGRDPLHTTRRPRLRNNNIRRKSHPTNSLRQSWTRHPGYAHNSSPRLTTRDIALPSPSPFDMNGSPPDMSAYMTQPMLPNDTSLMTPPYGSPFETSELQNEFPLGFPEESFQAKIFSSYGWDENLYVDANQYTTYPEEPCYQTNDMEDGLQLMVCDNALAACHLRRASVPGLTTAV